MPSDPTETVRELLGHATDPAVVHRLVAADATYVSLNFDNADLKRIMPWAGTSKGPQAIVDTYTRVARYWQNLGFAVDELFGSGENVAVFGRFTYRSNTLGREVTSPFSIFAKVRDGLVVHMQFMEDTFATAMTFRAAGTWTIRSDPDGPAIEV